MPWHRAGSCFTDDDLAFIELLFENHYGITSEKKILTALRVVANSNGYHPVREYLNHLDWDGTPVFDLRCIIFSVLKSAI